MTEELVRRTDWYWRATTEYLLDLNQKIHGRRTLLVVYDKTTWVSQPS